MGSTGEPDRKRRHLNSITSPTAAKKHSPFATSEDKKLDVVVLRYQNQKLVQQLEAQKVEYSSLENKLHNLVKQQSTYEDTKAVSSNSWEQLVNDLELNSARTSGSENGGYDMKDSLMPEDGASAEEDFLTRLLNTGATESCSDVQSSCQMECNIQTSQASTRNILWNILTAVNYVCSVNDESVSAFCMALPEDESGRQFKKAINDLQIEVRNFRLAIDELHLEHRPLVNKVQYHRDMDAKNKADCRRLAGELATTVAELEESNCKLSKLKAQKDAGQGAPLLFPALGNKLVAGDKHRNKERELQVLESTLKDLKNLVSSRLVEIKNLHDRRIEILRKLADMQNSLVNVQSISSSKGYLLLSEQMDKSEADMDQCRTSLEKLQVEKDNFTWYEKEVTVKADIADLSRRFSAFSESQIAKLEKDFQILAEEKLQLESKHEQSSREPGRKEIISEFKALVSSLPKNMAVMQSEVSRYKAATTEIHSVRAEVQSLSTILDRKVSQLEALSGRSTNQLSEIKKLQAVVQDLRDSDHELKLILDMYMRESTDSREIKDCRDMEHKAWAVVESLKSSLDEHNLEIRVKEANEAEAISQQRLATTEAEIADLRQNLELAARDICNSSDTLKSKHEEGEAYLSEIESIGQAYEDMQSQNQHLLQQVTERDDYNIKLVMDCLKARQQHDVLRSEISSIDKKIQRAKLFLDLFHQKVAWLDDQLKIWSDQIGRLVEDGWKNSTCLGDARRRSADADGQYHLIRQSLGERQTEAAKSRLGVSDLLAELEKERFSKKRVEETLEVMTRKATGYRAQFEGSAALGKLKQEIKEYRGILKCRVCHDHQKEVVIAKCYHLFCSQCVKKTLESRHRKCPTCGASFGPNDVKPIYI